MVGKTVKGINVIIISLDIFLSDVSKGTVFLHWSVANCGFRTLIRYNFNKKSSHVYDMVRVIILSFHVFYQHCFLSSFKRSFLRIRCFFFVMFGPCLLIVSYIVFPFFTQELCTLMDLSYCSGSLSWNYVRPVKSKFVRNGHVSNYLRFWAYLTMASRGSLPAPTSTSCMCPE